MTIFKSVLVIGPTGVGKSPLGDYIEQNGFRGARCGHFDFGENLRNAVANPSKYPGLTTGELAVIRDVLASGALLEDNQFSIVEKLFGAVVTGKRLGKDDWVLLNGMPRHAGQAEAVGRFADVRVVANLVCDEETVARRIVTNAGGDRAGRVDDDMAAVKNKLAIFKARTVPLLSYYRRMADVAVKDIPVDLKTTPEAIVTRIAD